MAEKGLKIVLALGLSLLVGFGCKREEVRYPGRRVRPAAPSAPSWGLDAEGLQCRIRPVKKLWSPSDTLSFKVDLRNDGKRVFAVSEPVRAARIVLDGRSHAGPDAMMGGPAKVHRLGPGVELTDLALNLPPATEIPLAPGRHEVQVVLVLEGVQVISGPTGIEITAVP